MDRFTWAVVAGVVGLAIVALVSATLVPLAQPPPDLSTPDGVVRAYVLALQNKQPDEAWDLLAPEGVPGFGGPRGRMDRGTFRQQVLNAPRERSGRVRILQALVLQTFPETARVETEVVTGNRGPWSIFGGSSTGSSTGDPPLQRWSERPSPAACTSSRSCLRPCSCSSLVAHS